MQPHTASRCYYNSKHLDIGHVRSSYFRLASSTSDLLIAGVGPTVREKFFVKYRLLYTDIGSLTPRMPRTSSHLEYHPNRVYPTRAIKNITIFTYAYAKLHNIQAPNTRFQPKFKFDAAATHSRPTDCSRRNSRRRCAAHFTFIEHQKRTAETHNMSVIVLFVLISLLVFCWRDSRKPEQFPPG